MTSRKPLPHRDVFEKLGETLTVFEFAGRSDDVGRAAVAWLYEKRSERDEAAADRRDAREEEILKTSRRANAIAITCIVTSGITTIIAACFIR